MRVDKYLASGMTFAEAAAARRRDREANAAANAAKRAEHAAAIENSHCQICERAILSNTGVVAHHGYQRPGHGWQTASCFGARYRPYEVACDALPPAIESLASYIAGRETALRKLKAYPPRGIERRDYNNRYNHYEYPRTYLRPANFDKTNRPAAYGRDDKYAQLYFTEISEIEMHIANANADLKRLRQRLAAWKKGEFNQTTK